MRLMLLAASGNSVGRSYCLWLIAQELGWTCTTVVRDAWPPLAGTAFAEQCVSYQELRTLSDETFDAIVAYQPFPETLGVALDRARGSDAQLVVDIDELGWEQRYGYSSLHRLRVGAAMVAHGRNPWPYQRLRGITRRVPITLSNPCLGRYYPGTVVPHVRAERPFAPWPVDDEFRVAFVGTLRAAKGVDELRAAVSMVDGVRLIVTDDRPADATAAETWTGRVTLDHGLRILDESHAVAVVSHDTEWTRHQFPVKLVDAMMAGRAIVASDLPPIRWAVGDSALLVPPGDADRLASALLYLSNHPTEARELGAAGRRRALETFTPARAAPAFAESITSTR